MAKHFGMKFVAAKEVQQIHIICENPYVIENSHSPYFFHPESLALFEPMVGDIAEDINGEPGTVFKNGGGYIGFAQDDDSRPLSVITRIIQRNNVAFMWPEFEEIE